MDDTTEPMKVSELPPLRPGKEWVYIFYPGGRKELRQYSWGLIDDYDFERSVSRLLEGKATSVPLAEGQRVWNEWQRRKAVDRD